MPTERICVPVIRQGGAVWAQLNYFGHSHIVAGESCWPKKEDFSYTGGHRVRLFAIKGNVHWKVPTGFPLDIAGVAPATPRRRLPGQ